MTTISVAQYYMNAGVDTVLSYIATVVGMGKKPSKLSRNHYR